ncbi:hypothetical protein LEN26_012288 [Aphanomyces euteiches]|nr:hypothetical protein LEN26_012288 [Aphanomyces euteiches]
MESIQMLGMELGASFFTPISSITFYSTTTSASHESTKAYIQQRVDAIVQANPWVTGQLKSGWFLSNLTLDFDPQGKPLAVEEAHIPELSPRLELSKLAELCFPFDVAVGTTLINSDRPLCRFTWITISDTQGALYFSLSHGIADGYTYYRLYGMLSAKTAVEALTPSRVLDFDARLDATVKDGNDSSTIMNSLAFMFNSTMTMAFGPSLRYTVHTVNAEWVAKEKDKYKAESPVGYVSTNDVLTSWVCRAMKCDIGFMAVNCRGRVDGVERHHAGNYEFLLGYQPEDYASPALIRESLATNSLRRARSGSFPAVWTSRNLGTTSWVSLYEPAELPGWTMVEHLPALLGSTVTPMIALIIFFQRTPTTIGVMFASREDLKVDNHPALAPHTA